MVTLKLYTRNHFSESMGLQFGGPGQKALQAMNEFALFVDFCLIPLSKTCSFDIPANNLTDLYPLSLISGMPSV